MKRLFGCGLLIALVAISSVAAVAQGSAESSVRGNLSGIVVDATGAIVPGAKITISGSTGTRSDITNQDGQFLFPLLTPGFYNVKIEKASFKTADVKNVEVVTGKTSSMHLAMEAGEASTVIEVQGNAITVDTTSTSVSASLTDTFYQSVPVARGVTGLFYASPGVTSGGGTGTANPSISGGTGLENLYVADGVNITDGGFGGIGVYSRVMGSLSTGINLSFVKEVNVKTGGFEAQYGKSTGGIVQIVTKSGTNQLHGSIGGYFAPEAFEATRLFTDDFHAGAPDERFNLQGKVLHQSNFDLDAEVGGYVPRLKEKLFFFGSFNPSWNTDHDRYADFHNVTDLGTGGLGSDTQPPLGNVDISTRVYSYAAKVTWKLNGNHQLESSIFGDPSYGDNSPNGPALVTASSTVSDTLQYGTRNWVVRYNGILSPTWLLNSSFSWGHNNLSDTPAAPDVYQLVDYSQRNQCGAPLFYNQCTATTNVLRGQFTRQGLGYYENTVGDNYGFNLDTSKTFRFLGDHTVAFGYRYEQSHYDGTKNRTGPDFLYPDVGCPNIETDGALPCSADQQALYDQLISQPANFSGQVRSGGGLGAALCGISELYITGLAQGGPANTCGDGGIGAYALQTRGEFGVRNFKTQGDYHTLFAQDTWTINKYVTINAGLRWEQQRISGVNAAYTFTDNWSPRVGVSIDPWGNRKTKIYANFGRYNESIPLDMAIRSLSAELDTPGTFWLPVTDGAGHVVVSPEGVITPDFSAAGWLGTTGSISAQTSVAFGAGTRMQYLDEYVLGFEHEFGNSGVIFTARYTDRRIKRIVEDMAALSPEAFQAGLNQNYLIANPSKNQDLFTNPNQIVYNSGGAVPASCLGPDAVNFTGPGSFPATPPFDSNGNPATDAAGNDSFCITNDSVAGATTPDGQPDGFVDPVRIYKSMEFEVNKSFSRNWQLRANYRIAKLFGNYEGTFRNDNGQNDPNISSLFDFTQGNFNLLGQQFVPGVLNTDVRHVVNGFFSYTFGNKWMKGLTLGTSTHFQTGIPINNLFAHPGYANSGEVPFCADNTTNCASARGSLGRTKNWGSVDLHADYPIRLTEKTKIRLAADLFNLTDMRTQLRVDQLAQRSLAVPNGDFGKPTGIGPAGTSGNTNPGYQRPFYARFGVKFEF